MRRLVLLLPVLVAAACSSGSGHGGVDDKDTRAAVADLFQRNAAEAPANSSCTGSLEWKVGATEKCTASDGAGKAWPVTAKVAKITGDKADVEASFDDRVVGVDDAKANITTMYRQIADNDVASVDCKGLQRLEANSSRKCTVTEVGGKTVGVTYVVSAVRGDGYSYEVNLGG